MSSSGFLFYLSTFQNTLALFSAKPKYMVACKAREKALQTSQFLSTLGFRLSTLLVDLHIDNKKAIYLIKNLKFYLKTKYIKVQYYQICDMIKSNKIRVFYILKKEILIDGLTKLYNLYLFKKFQEIIEMN